MNDTSSPKGRRPTFSVIAALTSVAIAMLAACVLYGCGTGAAHSEKPASDEGAPPVVMPANDLLTSEPEETEEEPDDGAVPDPELLSSIMGEDEATKLIEEAESSATRHWIASHPDAFAFEGDAVQMKMLTLAADDDEAVSFVRHFVDRYPAEEPLEDARPVAIGSDRKVPCLYQWDQRWGYTVYSSTAFGLTGCGPTALAMAYQGVTGKRDRSPYDMSLLAQELGCMARFEGTDTSFFYRAAPDLGITCDSISIGESQLRDELDQGHVVIANVAHGYFSHFDGHYLVLTGIDADGKLVINDPYSTVHSQQTWDIDFILGETKALFTFAKA